MRNRRSNITDSVREELEFNKVVDLLENFALSSENKNRIRSLSILHNPKVLNHHLDCLEEYISIHSDTNFPKFDYVDLLEVLKFLRIKNAVLTEDQFFEILGASNWINSLLQFIHNNEYEIPTILKLIGDLKKSVTIKKIIEKVFTPRRFIRSNASLLLHSIREDISKKRSQVDQYFQETMSHYVHLGYLDDIRESYADGVTLLAVKSEYKRKVKGQIRAQSKTKSISFIEPEKCISINRVLSHLYQEEKEEIRSILKNLTANLALHIDTIESYKILVEEIDFLNAKSKLAVLMKASRPKVSRSREIRIRKAYHPILLIENDKRGLKTIPQDINFDDKNRVVVISGPNAGGKSITLKTFGLNQLMLQAGLFIPVHPNSSMSVFHDMFTDIGDNQSIENELSTYSYRLTRMRDILANAGKSSFILIDEFGSGSDPSLGAELAGVFFDEIVKTGAYGVLTTHYGNIKVLADQTEFAENACMLFDESKLNPLFKLKLGQPGSSYTFEVARNVGLPNELIDRARSGLKSGTVRFEDTIHHYQRLTTELELSRDSVLSQETRVSSLKNEYDEKLKKLESKIASHRATMEFDSNLVQLGKRINKLVESYKNGSTLKSILPRLKKIIELESNRKQDQREDVKTSKERKVRKIVNFKIGDSVRIEGTNQQGELLELKSNSALLQIGIVKLEVNFEKLEKIIPK
jgi:DNA mismatch repair protein MutS2